MLWVHESQLPAWPAGPENGVAARAARAAREAARRLAIVRAFDRAFVEDLPPDGDGT